MKMPEHISVIIYDGFIRVVASDRFAATTCAGNIDPELVKLIPSGKEAEFIASHIQLYLDGCLQELKDNEN